MYSSWTHIVLTHHYIVIMNSHSINTSSDINVIKVTQPSLSQIIYTKYIFESHNLLNSQKPFSQLILKRIPNHAFSKPSIVMLTPYLEFIRCGTHFTIHTRDPLHYSHAGPTRCPFGTLIGQNFPCHLTRLSNSKLHYNPRKVPPTSDNSSLIGTVRMMISVSLTCRWNFSPIQRYMKQKSLI